MMYEIVTIKEKEYKLCLPMQHLIELEKKIGQNPLNKLMEMSQGNNLPEMEFIADVIHYSLKKFQPKININGAYEFIDEYFEEEDNDLVSLMELMMGIFNKSGFLKMNKVAEVPIEK